MRYRRAAAALTGVLMLGALTSCMRSTEHDSIYVINLENEVHWRGTGPDKEATGPFEDHYKVDHRRDVLEFPLERITPEQQERIDAIESEERRNALEQQFTMELEKDQSIYTADGNIVIQSMQVGYKIKDDEESVRKHFIDHRPEDLVRFEESVAGLIRMHLQTLPDEYIHQNQKTLGVECLEFVKGYAPNGRTLEDKWGVEIEDIQPLKPRLPSLVLEAYQEGERLIQKAKGDLDSARDEADRRREKLKGIREIVEQVGTNPAALNYLNDTALYEALEEIGDDGIKDIHLIRTKGSSDSAIVLNN